MYKILQKKNYKYPYNDKKYLKKIKLYKRNVYQLFIQSYRKEIISDVQLEPNKNLKKYIFAEFLKDSNDTFGKTCKKETLIYFKIV